MLSVESIKTGLQEAAGRLDEFVGQAARMGFSKAWGAPKVSDESEERSCQENSLNVRMVRTCAKVAELADAPDLGSGPARGGGSNPPFRTSALAAPARIRTLPFSAVDFLYSRNLESKHSAGGADLLRARHLPKIQAKE